VELTRTHHFVLYCAVDWLDIATLRLGMNLTIGSGEQFVLAPPMPPDEARRATLELLEAGAVAVSHLDPETGESRDLELDEARAVLAEPATWDLDASPPVAYTYEIGLTEAGWALYDESHRLFAAETERSLEQARERDAEFLRRHPDFVEKNARYLKALERWMTRGGPEPELPRFD
jgi:hypothetical protein